MLAVASISGTGWLNLERVMRAIMMDLGLGSVIEKFEEYFGKAAGKLLLLLIALAFLAWITGQALNVIIESKEIMESATGIEYYIATGKHMGVLFGLYIVGYFLIGCVFYALYIEPWDVIQRQIKGLLDQAEAKNKEAADAEAPAGEMIAQAEKAISEMQKTQKQVYAAVLKKLSELEAAGAKITLDDLHNTEVSGDTQ